MVTPLLANQDLTPMLTTVKANGTVHYIDTCIIVTSSHIVQMKD